MTYLQKIKKNIVDKFEGCYCPDKILVDKTADIVGVGHFTDYFVTVRIPVNQMGIIDRGSENKRKVRAYVC